LPADKFGAGSFVESSPSPAELKQDVRTTEQNRSVETPKHSDTKIFLRKDIFKKPPSFYKRLLKIRTGKLSK
jgi:hypothetical protein